MGVGYDGLNRVALAKANVTVCNCPDYGTEEVADHALALALSFRRGILIHNERQRANPPAPWTVSTKPYDLASSALGPLYVGSESKRGGMHGQAVKTQKAKRLHIAIVLLRA